MVGVDFMSFSLAQRTFSKLADGRPTGVEDCPRCHEGRHEVPAVAFARPLQIGNTVVTHYATCPTTGDPIILL